MSHGSRVPKATPGRGLAETEVRLSIKMPLAAAQAGRTRAKAQQRPSFTLATEWAEHLAQDLATRAAENLGGGVVENNLDYHPEGQVRAFEFVIRVPVAPA